MNDTQRVVIDMFCEFIKICKTLNLKWFMINGSALGAVKYSGFIPWDDDLDVGLLRADYETFLEKAGDLLPEHIFLQNYRTDKNFPHIYSKLRNSNTTFIEPGVAKINMNHGIFLDIFPLDYYPQEPTLVKRLCKRKKILNWKVCCALKDKSKLKIRVRNRIFRFLGYHKKTAKTLAKMDALFASFSSDQKSLCNHGDRMVNKGVLDISVYGQGTKMSFEGLEVLVPERYDEYLTHKYGDWREDPPEESQKSHHIVDILDTEKSYKNYV